MRYAIVVIDEHENQMPVRHGADIGEGEVVKFHSLAAAKRFAGNMANGLEDGWRVVFVPIGMMSTTAR